MAAGKFKLNYKAVGDLLKNDEGGKAAIRAAAQQVYDNLPADVKAEAEIVEYQTDRAVAGVKIPADKQAKHGAGTRAAAAAGLRQGRAG